MIKHDQVIKKYWYFVAIYLYFDNNYRVDTECISQYCLAEHLLITVYLVGANDWEWHTIIS